MASIADRLGVSGEHDLVIGASFNKGNKGSAFHSVRYDFKPASVDPSKTATVDVGDKHSVTVTVPHIEDTNQTVYRGNSRPYQKECVLVVDHETGVIRLERLTENIQVKKTRSEGPTPRMPAMPRPLTPIDPVSRRTSPSQQQSAAPAGPPAQQRLSPHSGPPRGARSSPTVRRLSPVPHQQAARREPPPPPPPPQQPAMPGSMPSIFGMLDEPVSIPMPTAAPPAAPPAAQLHVPSRQPSHDDGNGVMSDSDSDSESGSSSDSDMDVDSRPVPAAAPARQNDNFCMPSLPTTNLFTDLQLSDSD